MEKLKKILVLFSFFAGQLTWVSSYAKDPLWSQEKTISSPEARYDASMAHTQENPLQFYLFGGRDGQGCLNDLWIFDYSQKTWHQEKQETAPPARSGAGLVYDHKRNRLILFGGYCHSQFGNTKFYNDLWFFSKTDGWSREYTSGGPGPRAWYAMVIQKDHLLVYGGYGSNHFGELWSMDLESLAWEKKCDKGPKMAGRPSFQSDGEENLVFSRNGIANVKGSSRWIGFGNTWKPHLESTAPDGNFHFSLASPTGIFVVLKGPGDDSKQWQLWQAGKLDEWQHSRIGAGPETPVGIACSIHPQAEQLLVCFGGAFRDRVSDQTWTLHLPGGPS
jgi:hypothetical protein